MSTPCGPQDQPVLDATRFAQAFPFHLWLDADLRVLAGGASLSKALPALERGQLLHDAFEVRRPRESATLAHWRAHGGGLCTLKSHHAGPALVLRGNAEVLGDGGVLLLVTPVLTSLEDLRQHGLDFNDFAKHDATAEMLLLARSTQMAAADAARMASRLSERSAQLDSILELGRNGVLSFDAAGRVQHANGALLRMLGLARSSVLQMDLNAVQRLLDDRVDPADRGQLRLQLAQADGTADAPACHVVRLTVPRPWVLELSGRRSSDGSLVFYWRDMTTEFEVDRMKSEFLSTAAHELRTPMVSIFGFTELLLNRPVPEDRRRDVLLTMHRQATLLINMVNELLDLARIESRQGKDLQCRPEYLGALVRDTVKQMNPGAAQCRIEVALDAEHRLLMVDAAKTTQALTNVLSNALKYSPSGGDVVVDTLLDEAAGLAGLRVADSGIGMTPEHLARVCERFFRADPSGNIPGTGLGMSLVKEIVALQGGSVDIVSELGVGTTVILWLPLAPGNAPPALPGVAQAA